MSGLTDALRTRGSTLGSFIVQGAKVGGELGYHGAKAMGKGTKEVAKETAKGAFEGAKMMAKILSGKD